MEGAKGQKRTNTGEKEPEGGCTQLQPMCRGCFVGALTSGPKGSWWEERISANRAGRLKHGAVSGWSHVPGEAACLCTHPSCSVKGLWNGDPRWQA